MKPLTKSGIQSLPSDIVSEISKHLRDSEKLNLLSTCISFTHGDKLLFDKLYTYERIAGSKYFNSFTRLRYTNINEETKFPSSLIEISIITPRDLIYVPSSNKIQSVIIRLVNSNLTKFLHYIPHCRKLTIKKLKLKELYIPEGIQALTIDCIRMSEGKTLKLPSSLKYLKIKDISLFNLDVLPDSIDTLCIGSSKYISSSKAPKLPPKLQVLHSRNIDFSSIPDTIHTLKLLNKFKEHTYLPLPKNLKYLETDVYVRLPKNLEVLKLRPEYYNRDFATQDKKRPMRILDIPPTLKQLEGYYDPREMELNDSLEQLKLNIRHSIILGQEKLPRNLKVLHAALGKSSVIPSFPENLQEIKLAYWNYEPTADYVSLYGKVLPNFPHGLRKLKLVGIKSYNKPHSPNSPKLPEFPDSIECLSLDGSWYIPELPKNLKHLTLLFHENLPKLPESLEKLKLGYGPLPEKFPKNLKSLTLKSDEPLNLPDALSELKSLKSLFIDTHYTFYFYYELNFPPEFSFPDSIEELHIDVKSFPEYIRLPPKLKRLSIGIVKHQLKLPESITHLRIYYNCPKPITFPPCLKYLEFISDLSTRAIQGELAFPKMLEVLVLKLGFEMGSDTIERSISTMPRLPETLKELNVRDYLIENFDSVVFPKGLEILHMTRYESIPKTLPEHTEVIRTREIFTILGPDNDDWAESKRIMKY
jgi:hypothetical protein